MREFYFLRHGQTDWNVEGRMQGRADIPLNAQGIAQALNAAEHYGKHPIDRIVSSPQIRAHMTSQHIAERLRVPVDLDQRLMERCVGVVEGMTQEEINQGDPALLHDLTIANEWHPGRPMPKGSECMSEVAARAHTAVMNHLARHPDDRILFVAHGAWFRALAHHFTGEMIYSDNATPYIFSPQDATWLIKAAI